MATRDKRMCLPQICRCKTEHWRNWSSLKLCMLGDLAQSLPKRSTWRSRPIKDLNATDRFYGCRALFAHSGSGQQGIQHRDCLHLPRLFDDLMLLLPKPFTTHEIRNPHSMPCAPFCQKKTQLRDAKLICWRQRFRSTWLGIACQTHRPCRAASEMEIVRA